MNSDMTMVSAREDEESAYDTAMAAAATSPDATQVFEGNIFGGDSDLSSVEESGEEDSDDNARSGDEQSAAVAASVSRGRLLKKSTAIESDEGSSGEEESAGDDDEEDSNIGEDGEYEAELDAEAKSAKRKAKGKEPGEGEPKKKAYRIPKKKPRMEGELDDDEAGELRVKRKSKVKKAKQEVVEEDDAPVRELSPAAARRKNMKERIDDIIKKPKSKTAQGKKKRGDDDDLGAMNDDAVIDLRDKMMDAAAEDGNLNDNGKPAVQKLKMLSRVVEMMQKTSMSESLIENGILDAVTKWLEPLNDKSLPSLVIQRSLFNILLNMSIETFSLKGSKLGKIVYFYTKVRGVEPTIKRIADQLVINWLRPIIGRSKEYIDRDLTVSAAQYQERTPVVKLGSGNALEEAGVARRHARVPEAMTETFTVAPRTDLTAARERGGGGGGSAAGSMASSSKFREFKKKLIAGQQASRRV